MSINMDNAGRYAFLEFRTPDMATASMQLTGQVCWVSAARNIGSGEACTGLPVAGTLDIATASVQLTRHALWVWGVVGTVGPAGAGGGACTGWA